MDPLTTIVAAIVGGVAAAAGPTASQAVKDSYAGLRALLVNRFGARAAVEDALQRVEQAPQSEGRKLTLQEELERADVARDAQVLDSARGLLEALHQEGLLPREQYQAYLRGSGAIAQGPGATAAGKGGVAAGGNIQGSTIVTGNRNVVNTGEGDMHLGGIRARTIKADNVVDGAQVVGGDAAAARELVALAREIQRGGISADEILAQNVVSGLQVITQPSEATSDNLRREVQALREHLAQAVAQSQVPDPDEAADAEDHLERADEELAKPEPNGRRVVRRLKSASEILTGVAEAAQKLGQAGAEVLKLAPIAAALYQIAVKLFGG
jgi:hypothetical protein